MSEQKTKIAQKGSRDQETVNVKSPARVQRARNAGPHGKAVHADGSTQADANKHKRVDGGSQGPGGPKYKTITEK